VFNLRSATEMHQLGQMDVPVRNPKASLFAEDPKEKQTEEVKDAKETESENDADEPEEATDEETEEVVIAETPTGDKVVKPNSKGEKAEKSQQKSDEAGKAKIAGTSEEKPKPKPKTKPTEVVEESSEKPKPKSKNKTAEKSSEKSKDNSKASTTIPPSDTIESNPKKAVPQAAVETLPVSEIHETNELSNEKVGDARKSESALVTPKKMSLPGLKSAPASRASRVRSPSVDSNTSQVLGPEVLNEPSISQYHEQELPKSADTLMTDLPVTPPASSRKSQSFLDTTGAVERMPTTQRVPLPSPSALQGLRNDSQLGTYVMSHGKAAELPNYISPSFTQRPTRKVSFVDCRSFRAESEISDVPTEVADPAEIQARMDSQGWNSGSSLGHLVESQVSIGSNNYYESDSMTPEPRNHSEPSPILGSPRSFGHTQSTDEDKRMESYESTSTQLRQEIAQSFGFAAVGKDRVFSRRKVTDESSLAVSLHNDHKSPFIQPESFIAKRKAGETTGNGLVAESARPRKTSIAPANRSIIESLRRQQEENDRLEQELKDLRLYNATLENIRELRKHSHGVQESIDAEKVSRLSC
jgi:hypothetical protein